jgi:hypothetical protein
LRLLRDLWTRELLVALMDFEENRLSHASIVGARMGFARLKDDFPQIGDALLWD